MRPFPDASEVQFFIGRELDSLCLGPGVINFSFDGPSINVEGALEHVDKGGIRRRHNTDEDRDSPILLHRLLGQRVRDVAVERYCLTLTFDQGDVVKIFSEEGPYECGQIYDEQGKLTVF